MPIPRSPPTRPWDFVSRIRAWAGESGSTRRTLTRNGIWESGSFLAHALVMFFLSPFIVHRLGNGPYGIWEMVVSLTGFLSFADLGVRPAVVHFIARHDAQGNAAAVNRYVNTAFVTFAAAGALVLVAAVPLALMLPRFWDVAPGFQTEASLALIVMAGDLALGLPLNAFSAVLVGKQRYDLLGRARIAMMLVRAALIVLVLSRGAGLLVLAAVMASTRLLEMIWYTRTAFRIAPALRFAPRLASRDAGRRLLSFGGWAMTVIVGLQVIWATDNLVIGRALTAEDVTFFAIGFKLALYARELLRATARVVEPATGALHGRGDRSGIRRLLAASVRTMLLVAGPILVYLLVVGSPFLRQWMGDEYAQRSSGVLCIMTLAVLPAVASAPLAAVHYGTGRVRPLALLVALEAVLNLALSIALVGPYGIEGVAIGTAIPSWLIHTFLLPWLLCRHYGLSWPRFALATWVGPLTAGAVTWLALQRIVDPKAAYGWGTLVLLAVLTVGIYAATTLVIRWLVPSLMGGGQRPADESSGREER